MSRANPRTAAGLRPWICRCSWTACRAANSKYTELSARRFRPEISCSVPHRASGKAVPSLHPSSLFRVSGTQRTHSTTNARTAPLTLTPKSIRNFQRECALTRNRSVPQECAACIHRMQNARGLGTAQQAFWIWFLEIGFKNRAVVPRRTACGCYETSQGAFQIWKSFCNQDRPFSSSTWSGRLFFCSENFRVCIRSKQGEPVPSRNFWIRFYKSSFKTLVGLRPNPIFST